MSPAVHPPNNAVKVTYDLSLAAAVMARSAPPGIEECLFKTNQHTDTSNELKTHGFMAMLHIAWKTSAVWLVFTLTATGT